MSDTGACGKAHPRRDGVRCTLPAGHGPVRMTGNDNAWSHHDEGAMLIWQDRSEFSTATSAMMPVAAARPEIRLVERGGRWYANLELDADECDGLADALGSGDAAAGLLRDAARRIRLLDSI